MSMLVPRSNRIFNDLMTDPFDNFFGTMAAPSVKTTPNLMRTDIRETETGFELTIDLPGFDKEGVQAELKDGYLTVTAETKQETEDKKGTYVRQERFSGKCSRTFYVGDDIEEGDIKAKFDNGTLQIDVPKKVAKPEPETSRSITIDELVRTLPADCGRRLPWYRSRLWTGTLSPRTFSQLSPPYEDPIAACPRWGLRRFGCCLRSSRVP